MSHYYKTQVILLTSREKVGACRAFHIRDYGIQSLNHISDEIFYSNEVFLVVDYL